MFKRFNLVRNRRLSVPLVLAGMMAALGRAGAEEAGADCRLVPLHSQPVMLGPSVDIVFAGFVHEDLAALPDGSGGGSAATAQFSVRAEETTYPWELHIGGSMDQTVHRVGPVLLFLCAADFNSIDHPWARVRLIDPALREQLDSEKLAALRDRILAGGQRKTYGNRFNHNPWLRIGKYDLYLNPTGNPHNVDCEAGRSDFNELTVAESAGNRLLGSLGFGDPRGSLRLEGGTPESWAALLCTLGW